jgi:hypoxanthine phosphoribosyltransferase
MEFMRISWEEGAELCEQLVHKTDDYRPDILIGVSRGGLVPLRIFSDMLGIKRIGVLGIQFYKKMGETRDFPEITYEMPLNIEGKKVLIIDDVAHTGKSLVAAKEYIEKRGASDIRIATLHYHPTSILRPDYFVEMTNTWIIYPWERHEAEREIKEKSQTL